MAVGLGAACRLAREQPCADHLASLTTYFWNRLKLLFGPRIVLNGHAECRLPNTLNVSFPGYLGQDILDTLDGVAASTGSACHTGTHVMSPVLAAMGQYEEVGLGAIRFSLGRQTAKNEIDRVIEMLKATVAVRDQRCL